MTSQVKILGHREKAWLQISSKKTQTVLGTPLFLLILSLGHAFVTAAVEVARQILVPLVGIRRRHAGMTVSLELRISHRPVCFGFSPSAREHPPVGVA